MSSVKVELTCFFIATVFYFFYYRMVSTFRKNTALLFFVVKRLGIVTGILLAVSTGFFHDTAHTEVAAYYSTFATPYAS